jgi:protein-tyrosine phosphatase
MKILMVCLGNICRSPLAQGLLEAKIKRNQLDWVVDSAGTGNWHIGDPPDSRSVKIARLHGIDITQQRGRQFSVQDFDIYDLILPMDQQNMDDILYKSRSIEHEKKVRLILDFHPTLKGKSVPDPYWDDSGFENVFQILDEATEEMIKKMT